MKLNLPSNSKIWRFYRSKHSTGVVTRVTRWVPLVERELVYFRMIDTAWVEERISPIPSWREEFEDTKVVIRIRSSKRNRQHNGEMKRY
jgi:hypothetical protein